MSPLHLSLSFLFFLYVCAFDYMSWPVPPRRYRSAGCGRSGYGASQKPKTKIFSAYFAASMFFYWSIDSCIIVCRMMASSLSRRELVSNGIGSVGERERERQCAVTSLLIGITLGEWVTWESFLSLSLCSSSIPLAAGLFVRACLSCSVGLTSSSSPPNLVISDNDSLYSI